MLGIFQNLCKTGKFLFLHLQNARENLLLRVQQFQKSVQPIHSRDFPQSNLLGLSQKPSKSKQMPKELTKISSP